MQTVKAPKSKLSGIPLTEVLSKARDGSILHFAELEQRMKQSFTLEMLDPILHQLQAASTPLSDLTKLKANIAACSLTLFENIKEWQFSDASHKKAVAKKLLPELGNVCYWLKFAMHRLYHSDFRKATLREGESCAAPSSPYTDKEAEWCIRGARVFYSLSFLDDTIRKAMFATPQCLELIVSWWVAITTRDELILDDSPKVEMGHPSRSDPSTILFGMAVEADPKGVADAIVRGKVCTPDVFVKMTLRRLRHFADGDNLQLLPTCIETADGLIRCNAQLLSAFIDAKAIPAYIEILVEVNSLLAQHLRSKKATEESKRNQSVVMAHVFRQASWVLKWIELLPVAEVAPTVRRAISKGAVQMLSDIALMPRAQRQIQFNEQFPAFIGTLREYATFPKAVLPLQKAVHKCTSPIIDRVASEWTRNDFVLKDVMRKIDLCSQFLSKQKRQCICDNATHQDVVSKSKFREAKTCSKCHSVVYCSRECQKLDWDACHRLECRDMHREYLERKHDETFYSHGTRAFQVSVLVYFYETYMFAFLATRTKYGNGGQVVAVLSDLQHAPAGTNRMQPFSEWIRTNGPLVPKHKQHRLFKMTKRFSSHGESSAPGAAQLCLLHGIFGMNDLDFNVVILVRHIHNTVPYSPGWLPSPKVMEKASNFANRDVSKHESDYRVEETLQFTTPYNKQDCDQGANADAQKSQNFANFFAMHGISVPEGFGSNFFPNP